MVSLIRVFLLDNRNFLYYLVTQVNLTFYSHIIDYETLKIFVKNTSNQSFCICYCHKLGHLPYMNHNNYFLVDTQSACNLAAVLLLSHAFSDLNVELLVLPAYSSIETVFDNRIKAYVDANFAKQILELVMKYLSIWKS